MLINLVILLLIGYVVTALIAWVCLNMSHAAPSAWNAVASPFSWIHQESAQRMGRQRLEHELAARIQNGTRADEYLLDAAQATTQIQVAHLWLKESTATCLDTHWALATGLAVEHMSEAASHPRAVAMRQHNLELAEFLGDIVKQYPYPTSELIRLEVVIPRLAASCAACPYWFTTRPEAPRVCPPARALGYPDHPHGSSTGIIDAEPVFDEE